jgi:hypothetical protein
MNKRRPSDEGCIDMALVKRSIHWLFYWALDATDLASYSRRDIT